MITWVTVWVLTVYVDNYSQKADSYQLTYEKQEICLKQLKKHKNKPYTARCDFQQIPVVTK